MWQPLVQCRRQNAPVNGVPIPEQRLPPLEDQVLHPGDIHMPVDYEGFPSLDRVHAIDSLEGEDEKYERLKKEL